VRSVFVQSFGCRASQADGAAIEASLEDAGWQAVFRFSVKWREERPPLVSIPRGAWIFKA
jgi:hypothetical protein